MGTTHYALVLRLSWQWLHLGEFRLPGERQRKDVTKRIRKRKGKERKREGKGKERDLTHDSQLISIEGKLIDLFLGISQEGVKGKKERKE